jgi:tRNA pseudouridine13 synthase
MSDPTARLPHALGGPVCHGTIKLTPEDFVVEEILGFEPSGEGEHVFLRIEKRGENTDYVARQLARFAGVSSRNVSYAGLKDRHGRTLQWFSIQLPGQSGPDWSGLDSDTIKVLDVIRNARKLRKGATSGNRFELTVRDLTATNEALEKRLADIARYGTPNYFGPQRFGHDGQNIEQARALFAEPGRRIDPHKRGLYLSAARSEIFNHILDKRVSAGKWDQAIPGDVFMFSDSKSFFKPDGLDAEILQRVRDHAIHPSGVLWGRDPSTATDEALQIENEVAAHLADLTEGLAASGMDTARRPLRLCPMDLTWAFPDPATLKLSFTLPTGAYATTVLRELIDMDAMDA